MYKLCNMDPQECLCHATGEISWICQKRSISGKKKAGIFKLALNLAKTGKKQTLYSIGIHAHFLAAEAYIDQFKGSIFRCRLIS